MSIAYKGYLVRSSISGTWIEKWDRLICWADDAAQAKRIIDELTRED